MPVVDITKDLDALTLTIVADFAAPVERVWQLYADSADWITLISGFMIQTACLALAGLGLLRRGDSRAWGLLLLALAVIRLLVNLDDWRAVFLAVAGAMCVGLMVLMFRKSPGPNPGTPALS